MSAIDLVRSLVATAKRQEIAIHDDLIRLKERREQLRQHRMELEEVADRLKAEEPNP